MTPAQKEQRRRDKVRNFTCFIETDILIAVKKLGRKYFTGNRQVDPAELEALLNLELKRATAEKKAKASVP